MGVSCHLYANFVNKFSFVFMAAMQTTYGTEINNKENKAMIQAIKRETTNALHTQCICFVL